MIFSISIPVKGGSEHIQTALDSIRHQPVQFELAVLDATSDNSCQKVISNYRDMIYFEYHRQDAGQSAAIQ